MSPVSVTMPLQLPPPLPVHSSLQTPPPDSQNASSYQLHHNYSTSQQQPLLQFPQGHHRKLHHPQQILPIAVNSQLSSAPFQHQHQKAAHLFPSALSLSTAPPLSAASTHSTIAYASQPHVGANGLNPTGRPVLIGPSASRSHPAPGQPLATASSAASQMHWSQPPSSVASPTLSPAGTAYSPLQTRASEDFTANGSAPPSPPSFASATPPAPHLQPPAASPGQILAQKYAQDGLVSSVDPLTMMMPKRNRIQTMNKPSSTIASRSAANQTSPSVARGPFAPITPTVQANDGLTSDDLKAALSDEPTAPAVASPPASTAATINPPAFSTKATWAKKQVPRELPLCRKSSEEELSEQRNTHESLPRSRPRSSVVFSPDVVDRDDLLEVDGTLIIRVPSRTDYGRSISRASRSSRISRMSRSPTPTSSRRFTVRRKPVIGRVVRRKDTMNTVASMVSTGADRLRARHISVFSEWQETDVDEDEDGDYEEYDSMEDVEGEPDANGFSRSRSRREVGGLSRSFSQRTVDSLKRSDSQRTVDSLWRSNSLRTIDSLRRTNSQRTEDNVWRSYRRRYTQRTIDSSRFSIIYDNDSVTNEEVVSASINRLFDRLDEAWEAAQNLDAPTANVPLGQPSSTNPIDTSPAEILESADFVDSATVPVPVPRSRKKKAAPLRQHSISRSLASPTPRLQPKLSISRKTSVKRSNSRRGLGQVDSSVPINSRQSFDPKILEAFVRGEVITVPLDSSVDESETAKQEGDKTPNNRVGLGRKVTLLRNKSVVKRLNGLLESLQENFLDDDARDSMLTIESSLNDAEIATWRRTFTVGSSSDSQWSESVAGRHSEPPEIVDDILVVDDDEEWEDVDDAIPRRKIHDVEILGQLVLEWTPPTLAGDATAPPSILDNLDTAQQNTNESTSDAPPPAPTPSAPPRGEASRRAGAQLVKGEISIPPPDLPPASTAPTPPATAAASAESATSQSPTTPTTPSSPPIESTAQETNGAETATAPAAAGPATVADWQPLSPAPIASPLSASANSWADIPVPPPRRARPVVRLSVLVTTGPAPGGTGGGGKTVTFASSVGPATASSTTPSLPRPSTDSSGPSSAAADGSARKRSLFTALRDRFGGGAGEPGASPAGGERPALRASFSIVRRKRENSVGGGGGATGLNGRWISLSRREGGRSGNAKGQEGPVTLPRRG
ncbi:hypothetical protein DFJ73DRAFT_964896 [Zopfochytrium polystomum]|nr:hypothetical protein DFJ73DRAFT_964896 [Zopfochytrium polystomum]